MIRHPRLAITLGVGVVIAFGILVELLLERGPGTDWSATLQVLSSLILVAITSVYVVLTYRMLQVQQHPVEALRLERQVAAVHELSGRLLEYGEIIDQLAGPYPLRVGVRPPPDELVTSVEEEQVLRDLVRLSYVLPGEIGGTASRFAIRSGLLMALSSRIAVATVREDLESSEQHRPWDWHAFVQRMQLKDSRWWSDEELPTTLAARGFITSARSDLTDLQEAVIAYFQPNVVRQPSGKRSDESSRSDVTQESTTRPTG